MNKQISRSISLIAVVFVGFLFVTGIAAQSTRSRPEPPCPPAVKTPPPAAPRGAGVGAATGTGIGAANGTGIGAANGRGIGTAEPVQAQTVIAGPNMRELWFRTLSATQPASRTRASDQTGTAAGSGVGTATATPTETTPPPAQKVMRTYIKEMDGTCYYVTNDGSKKFVAAKKCELY